MKLIIFIAAIFLAINCNAQPKKDTVIKINQDSAQILNVLNGFYFFVHEKNIGVKDFEVISKLLQDYLDDVKKKNYKIK